MKGMVEDLSQYDIDAIDRAFKIWRQESEKVPTIAGMMKILNGDKPREVKTFKDAHNPKYNELTAKGQDLFDMAMAQAKLNIKSGVGIEAPRGAVPWYGKMWRNFTTSDRKALGVHVSELLVSKGEQVAAGYMKYLNEKHSVPEDLFSLKDAA